MAEPWSFPPSLRSCRFVMAVDEDDHDVTGMGSAWFRTFEAGGRDMVELRCGRNRVIGEVNDHKVWRHLATVRESGRYWFMNVTPEPVSGLAVELFGVSDVVDIDGATFHTSDADPGLPALFMREDAWSSDSLMLVCCDLTDGRLYLRNDGHEAELLLTDAHPQIGVPSGTLAARQMVKWLVLRGAGDPSQVEAGADWSDEVLERLRRHMGGLGSFMEAWRTYSDAEEASLLELRDQMGSVRFGAVRRSANPDRPDALTVWVNPHEEAAGAFLARLVLHLSEGRSMNLEVSEDRADFRDGLPGRDTTRVRRVCTVEAAMPNGDISLRALGGSDVPNDGWMCVSVAGDIRQIERRREALQRLEADQAGISTLRAVLAGRGNGLATPARPLRAPLPASVTQAGLTPRQLAAVRMALATPDIALIQGPPGTGKTKVITAIEEALAHMEGASRSTRLVLLTSTQNDAVDQVASRTRVFGLPPYRDNRGAINPIADWRRERLMAAHRMLADDTAHSTGVDVASVHHRLATTSVRVSDVIEALDRLATRGLTDEISRAARGLAGQLRTRMMKPSTREKLERRIRALRASELAYLDDGPARLADLTRTLSDGKVHPMWNHRFLERANQIPLSESPPWRSSAALRNDMLDTLAAETDERPAPASKEVLDLFAEAVGVAKRQARKNSGAVITIGEAMERYVEDIEQHPKEADEAIRDYTLVHAATCQRSSQYLMRSGRPDGEGGFENTIVDEAGRVSPLDLVIPLIQARKRVVLVGDHRQLPAVYDESIARGLPQAQVLGQCLFERLFQQLQAVGERSGLQRTVTLDQQFRMHPTLGHFVSSTFYEPYGETVQSPLGPEHFQHEFPGFEGRVAAWVDVPRQRGEPARSSRKSWSRDCEAEVVADLVRRFVMGCPTRSVGVITFYGDQRDRIKELLLGDLTEVDRDGVIAVHSDFREIVEPDGSIRERLRFGTVDAFQGKEFDAVILSMVRSGRPAADRPPGSVFGFLAVENRFCVALSRQQRLLVVVGDKAMADLPQAEYVRGLRELRDLCDNEARSRG